MYAHIIWNLCALKRTNIIHRQSRKTATLTNIPSRCHNTPARAKVLRCASRSQIIFVTSDSTTTQEHALTCRLYRLAARIAPRLLVYTFKLGIRQQHATHFTQHSLLPTKRVVQHKVSEIPPRLSLPPTFSQKRNAWIEETTRKYTLNIRSRCWQNLLAHFGICIVYI